MDAQGTIAPFLLAGIMDFIRMYAQDVQHGTEQEIPFRQLHARDLSAEHRQVMESWRKSTWG